MIGISLTVQARHTECSSQVFMYSTLTRWLRLSSDNIYVSKINNNLKLKIIKNLIKYLNNNNITYKNNNNKFIIIPNTSPQLDYLLNNYNTTTTNTQLFQTYIIEINLNK